MQPPRYAEMISNASCIGVTPTGAIATSSTSHASNIMFLTGKECPRPTSFIESVSSSQSDYGSRTSAGDQFNTTGDQMSPTEQYISCGEQYGSEHTDQLNDQPQYVESRYKEQPRYAAEQPRYATDQPRQASQTRQATDQKRPKTQQPRHPDSQRFSRGGEAFLSEQELYRQQDQYPPAPSADLSRTSSVSDYFGARPITVNPSLQSSLMDEIGDEWETRSEVARL